MVSYIAPALFPFACFPFRYPRKLLSNTAFCFRRHMHPWLNFGDALPEPL